MDRKNFLKKSILGSLIMATNPVSAALSKNEIDELKPLEVVGFNHIENTNSQMNNHTIIHRAETRGFANHGWLKSFHTFSFANYYNPERMHFGVLRVLNDDEIAGGTGFGTHPHDNMEIISIPISGALRHKDSMGNTMVIKSNEIQVMSAGSGITHSEFNNNSNEEARFLQIWVFPNKKNVSPRYDQMTLDLDKKRNQLSQIISPNPDDDGLWIHQNAWFHMGKFETNKGAEYPLKSKNNGLYAFVIEGSFQINGETLERRDAMGIWNFEKTTITAKENDATILLMEVPMQLE